MPAAVRQHQPLAGRRRHRDLDRRVPRPAAAGHAGLVDQRVRDPAVVDRHDLVRAVPAQARRPVVVDGELHPGAPAEPCASPGTSSTSTARSSPASRLQLLAHHRGLERPLRRAATRAASRSRRTGPGRPTGTAARPGPATARATSTASARQNADPSCPSVTTTRTRSPGSACRTKTTRPSCRATQWPPCATGPTSTSSVRPTADIPTCRALRTALRRGRRRRAGTRPAARPRPGRPGPRSSSAARARW